MLPGQCPRRLQTSVLTVPTQGKARRIFRPATSARGSDPERSRPRRIKDRRSGIPARHRLRVAARDKRRAGRGNTATARNSLVWSGSGDRRAGAQGPGEDMAPSSSAAEASAVVVGHRQQGWDSDVEISSPPGLSSRERVRRRVPCRAVPCRTVPTRRFRRERTKLRLGTVESRKVSTTVMTERAGASAGTSVGCKNTLAGIAPTNFW